MHKGHRTDQSFVASVLEILPYTHGVFIGFVPLQLIQFSRS